MCRTYLENLHLVGSSKKFASEYESCCTELSQLQSRFQQVQESVETDLRSLDALAENEPGRRAIKTAVIKTLDSTESLLQEALLFKSNYCYSPEPSQEPQPGRPSGDARLRTEASESRSESPLLYAKSAISPLLNIAKWSISDFQKFQLILSHLNSCMEGLESLTKLAKDLAPQQSINPEPLSQRDAPPPYTPGCHFDWHHGGRSSPTPLRPAPLRYPVRSAPVRPNFGSFSTSETPSGDRDPVPPPPLSLRPSQFVKPPAQKPRAQVSHLDLPAPNVQILKTFRVKEGSSRHKIIEAALTKYKIGGSPGDYDLYYTTGAHKRLLSSSEQPLQPLKDLHNQGQQPIFMLCKRVEGSSDSLTLSATEPMLPAPSPLSSANILTAFVRSYTWSRIHGSGDYRYDIRVYYKNDIAVTVWRSYIDIVRLHRGVEKRFATAQPPELPACVHSRPLFLKGEELQSLQHYFVVLLAMGSDVLSSKPVRQFFALRPEDESSCE